MTALKCPICGAPVPPSKARPRKYCSLKCAQKVASRRYRERAHANAPTKLAVKSLREMQKDREDAKLKAWSRLEKRDADYAASPCAAPVTVEERGGIRIETRGQRCIGWRSSSHVSHS